MKIGNFLKKVITFLSEVKTEMRKVSWLSWEQTWKYTLIVIGTSIAVAILLGTLDAFFTWIINKII